MKLGLLLCCCLLWAGCLTVNPPASAGRGTQSGRADAVSLEKSAVPVSPGDLVGTPLRQLAPSAVASDIYGELETQIKTGAPGAQDAAIRRLAKMGDVRAVVVLGRILEDEALSDAARHVSTPHPTGTDAVVYDTLGGMSVRALGEMDAVRFEHPDYRLQVLVKKEEVARWRSWWREHKTSLLEQARLLSEAHPTTF